MLSTLNVLSLQLISNNTFSQCKGWEVGIGQSYVANTSLLAILQMEQPWRLLSPTSLLGVMKNSTRKSVGIKTEIKK